VKIDERALLSFDWLWFLALVLLMTSGVLCIWSSTPGTGVNSYFGRQLLYVGIGLLLFFVGLYFDYHLVTDYVVPLYIGGVLGLALVLVAGHSVHANKSWLYGVQPSELAKVLTIAALAKYYSQIGRDYLELPELFKGGMIVALPMSLVMLQGDLGTAITFVPIFLALSFIAGLKRKYVLVSVVAVLLAAPAGWMMLKDYQKGRIQTIFNPANDPHHLGYQTIQSKIAIGSGRFVGKGFKQGSQSQLGFLPARHTDFVFAVLGEEKGFAGTITVLGLFLFVSLRLIRTAREAKDTVGAMLVLGVLALLLFHLMINIGMVLGLVPIAGIPLPFVSAGGSSLISFLIGMSLCMNVRVRRYVN